MEAIPFKVGKRQLHVTLWCRCVRASQENKQGL
uniref:Uncharacterized protein n=1 Tax=Arundo donax TaxID=35708 RepID=A0A0A9FA06_ARUDO